jgi:hypothetical protein
MNQAVDSFTAKCNGCAYLVANEYTCMERPFGRSVLENSGGSGVVNFEYEVQSKLKSFDT